MYDDTEGISSVSFMMLELSFPLRIEQYAQPNQHLIVRNLKAPLRHGLLGPRKEASVNDRIDGRIVANPQIGRIVDQLLSQTPGCPVVHDVPDIVLVLENGVNDAVSP